MKPAQDIGSQHSCTQFTIHDTDKNNITADCRPFPERRCLPYLPHKGTKCPSDSYQYQPGNDKACTADTGLFQAKRRFFRAHISQGNQKGQSQMGYERNSRTGPAVTRLGSNGNGNNKKAHKYALTENITPPAHAICLLKEKSFTV